MANSAGLLQIGGNTVSAVVVLDDEIDDLRVYNRALTLSQIDTDMNTLVKHRRLSAIARKSMPRLAWSSAAKYVAHNAARTLSWNASTRTTLASLARALTGASLSALVLLCAL